MSEHQQADEIKGITSFDRLIHVLLETGELHDDPVVAVDYHVRLGHTQLVNPVPDRFNGLFDRLSSGCLHVFGQQRELNLESFVRGLT